MTLAHPAALDEPLGRFLAHFHIDPQAAPETVLRQVVTAFAQLPYENLTKIIKEAATGRPDQARRSPAEVIADHIALGAGGTCFSLTAALLHLLRGLGWQAEPLLADRPYGPDTHCALAVWMDGSPYLVDPGYLLTEPIPLTTATAQCIPTSFHEIRLVPRAAGAKLDLLTVNRGNTTLRITFKTAPADWGEFVKVWDRSFDWDMMRYPVLTRVAGGRHLYLQGNRFQARSREAVERTEIAPDELAGWIARTFGINRELAAKALTILYRKENRGNGTGEPGASLGEPGASATGPS
jgi:arylamine N-acetyltransferase